MTSKNYAAIDLGSNACRLLICDDCGRRLYADNYSTRLAEGMERTGNLTEAAINRGKEAFIDIRRLLDKYKVTSQNLRAVTTAACRMAKNGREFIDEIKKISGVELEIIDGREEAELNLQGASEHVKGKSKYLVIWDVGGGSTEVSLATNGDIPNIIKTISIPYGARNGADKFDLHEYDEIKAAHLIDEIDGYLQKFLSEVKMPMFDDISFVATSSTALRLAAIIEGKKIYNRDEEDGQVITADQVFDILPKIYKSSVDELAQNPCIGETRAPIFMVALIIFARIMFKLNADNVTVSLRSAKDAIVANLIERDRKNG